MSSATWKNTNVHDELDYISPRLVRRNLVIQKAQEGSADVQYDVALSFLEGSNGFPQDEKRAVYWLTQSANNGNLPALNQLGVCHVQGSGITKNEAAGFELLQFAADHGDVTAMVNAANLAIHGKGTLKNRELGALYLQKAASAGDGEAAYQLGQMYMQGWGLEADSNKALEYLSLASDLGVQEARTSLENAKSQMREVDVQGQFKKRWVEQPEKEEIPAANLHFDKTENEWGEIINHGISQMGTANTAYSVDTSKKLTKRRSFINRLFHKKSAGSAAY